MVYKRVTTTRLGKFAASVKRKRTGNATKVKFQAPTARNQRKQILTNALAIKRLYKVAMPRQVFCDWQLVGRQYARIDGAGGYTTTWQAFPLMSTLDWQACLRQDDNVVESSQTTIQRLCLNLRYSLDLSNWAQFNVWIVTPRKDAAARDPTADIAAGSNPVQLVDYIEGVDAWNLRLNPALYKVHFASYRTLTETTLFQAALPAAPAGNPSTTWAKGQANIKCNCKVRAPTGGDAWKSIPYMSKPYYQRYFLLVAIVSQTPAGAPGGRAASFTFDQLATTVNMD